MTTITANRSRMGPGVPGVRRVVILAVPPALALDVVGPADTLAGVSAVSPRIAPGYEVEVVAAGRGRTVRCESGLSIVAHQHYRQVRGDVDTLLVAGGAGARTSRDPVLLAWLRRMAGRVRRLGAICTGTFLLAEAGLLAGRRAATHWRHADELASRYPQIRVDASSIWVQDGGLYTSAGVTAGMDLALALVEEDFGSDVALQVARDLVLFLRRPGGQAQFSATLSAQAADTDVLRELQAWMAEKLRGDLSVEALASRAAMSPRNFARVFAREMGVTPARYVERLRVESARHRLERSDRSLDEVAAACGFRSADVMARAFRRALDTTPHQYRTRFRGRR